MEPNHCLDDLSPYAESLCESTYRVVFLADSGARALLVKRLGEFKVSG